MLVSSEQFFRDSIRWYINKDFSKAEDDQDYWIEASVEKQKNF